LSADEHLSPQQFYYHGTNAELAPGDFIESADQVGNWVHTNARSGTRSTAYVSDQEEGAWPFAHSAAKQAVEKGEPSYPYVYEVEPEDTPVEGPFSRLMADDSKEFMTSRAKVRRRIDIPKPGSHQGLAHIGAQRVPYDAVQGTLFSYGEHKKQLDDSEIIQGMGPHADQALYDNIDPMSTEAWGRKKIQQYRQEKEQQTKIANEHAPWKQPRLF